MKLSLRYKRLFDLTAALLGLIVLSPLLLLLAGLIAWKLGWPVFFTQERPGRHGLPFRMIKFRTMTNARDAQGKLLPDAERLTTIGKIVRSTSLDELPQLINVLKGDMSLVGPRPLLPQYLPLYNQRQARRHEVKPGITGWTQVNGRNALAWKEKFEMDVWYVENLSFALDMKICFLTLIKVLKREGINATDSASGVTFTGNGE